MDREKGTGVGSSAPSERSSPGPSDAYEAIRKDIQWGLRNPGERIIEGEVAAQIGVSRTPVREALIQLRSDGLVTNGRSGWLVRRLSASEVREVYVLRAGLEGYAASIAATRFAQEPPEEQDKIRESVFSVRALSANTSTNDYFELVRNNEIFHDRIIALAENSRLSTLARRERSYYFNVMAAGAYSSEDFGASRTQHADIVESIISGDARAAEDAAQRHVFEALRILESRGLVR